ncbi:MAG: hypothetical protein PHN75_08045 [Syntrophales bacterium]|nr:hypothetical protein [Syntrophales bacterium]
MLIWIFCCFTAPSYAASECRIPSRLPDTRPVEIDWSNPKVKTDNYILVLSWSPEYCSRKGRNFRDDYQCRYNSFEFVVHGLWPQSETAKDKFGHPRFCRTLDKIDQGVIKKHFCTMPNPDLMQEEWAKHGSCAFDKAASYFNKIEDLSRALRKPDIRALHSRMKGDMTAGDVVRAFVLENRTMGLTQDNLVVWVAKGNYLREVVICYDNDFAFKDCQVRGTPNKQRIRVAY